MPRKLTELQRVIMDSNLTDEEWLALDKEVKEALSIATEEEEEEFTDSGAGESLYMICSGIEYFRDKDS